MKFTIESALQYIKNNHINMYNYIIKKNKNIDDIDLDMLKDYLLDSNDCFLLSFVKYFNLNINFFSIYESYYFKILLEDKWYTSFYLLSLNDEYKNINWYFKLNNNKTHFGYLIYNLLCFDMIKYLIDNDSNLLNINEKFKNHINVSCIEELFKSPLTNKITYFTCDESYNYPLYDIYCEKKIYNNNFKKDFLKNEKKKLSENALNLSIYLHNKLIENNIYFRYGLYTTIIDNQFIEYEGIVIKSIKLNFFDFIDYLLINSYFKYDFIVYTEENKINFQSLPDYDDNKDYIEESYYKENDLISLCIRYVYECNQKRVILYIKEYFNQIDVSLTHFSAPFGTKKDDNDLKNYKKKLYIELCNEYCCFQILEYLNNL